MYIKEIHFSTEACTGPDGENLLIPKDECIGIMIYDFHSREFGFGFYWDNFSDADLKRINDFISEKANTDTNSANIL